MISFVIPAYNEEKRIPACLESVFKEIKKNKNISSEVIVVNNASNDHTKKMAKGYSGTIVIDEPRKGANRARQAGFLKAKGDLIANIDADTILPSGWLKKVIREFSENPKLICLSGPHFYYDAPTFTRAMTKVFYVLGFAIYAVNKHILKVGSMVQGGNFIVRRSALEKIGGFDTSIEFYGDDTDVAKRLNKVGDVKFTFSLPIYASGRRLSAEGLLKAGAVYAANFLSVSYFKKPVTKKYSDFRQTPDAPVREKGRILKIK